ncbi:MAG: DUF937 domain-containing protein [Mycobacteriaceae bacterium]
MSAIDEILNQLPVDQIADRLGVDASTAESAVRQALPALLGGLQANAQDEAGAASLASALQNHDGSLLDGGVDVDQVDTADGEKIVTNVFGDNTNQVISALGGAGGSDNSGLVAKLLPILAPIVLAYISKKFTQQGSATESASSGGGLGDLLGGLLGGQSSGGGLGGLLGSVLSGSGGSSGGLGDLLGGLLGGGKK